MNRPIDDFLPHTGPARLVTALSHCDADSIVLVGEIPVAHPLVCDGAAPALLGIEIGAQAAAAMQTMQRHGGASAGAGPVHGRLVRVRDASFSQPTLPAGVPLDVTAHLVALALPLARYRIAVSLDGVERVTATLSTYAAPDPASS